MTNATAEIRFGGILSQEQIAIIAKNIQKDTDGDVTEDMIRQQLMESHGNVFTFSHSVENAEYPNLECFLKEESISFDRESNSSDDYPGECVRYRPNMYLHQQYDADDNPIYGEDVLKDIKSLAEGLQQLSLLNGNAKMLEVIYKIDFYLGNTFEDIAPVIIEEKENIHV